MDELLDLISNSCGKGWHQDKAYQLAWKDKYDAMVEFYVEKVMYFANEYLTSPGGIRYHDDVMKKRRGGKAMPILNITTLQKYDGEKGIEWGMEQVLNMFEILQELAEVTEFQETSVYIENSDVLI